MQYFPTALGRRVAAFAALTALVLVPAHGATAQASQEARSSSSATTQVLQGRVLGKDGLPSAGLKIRAQHTAGDETKGFALKTRKKEHELGQLGAGEPEASTVTNRLGEFRLEGLAEGSYFVWTKASAYEHRSVYSAPLTQQPIAAGQEPVDLVHDQASLLVVLTKPDGSAWLGPTESGAIDDESEPLPGWSAPVRVRLSPAMAVGDDWTVIQAARPDYVHGVPTGDGAIRFDVAPGGNYLLQAIGMGEDRVGFDGRSQHVVASVDASSTVATLRAGPLPEFGTLELSVDVRRRRGLASSAPWLPGPKGAQRAKPSAYSVDYGSYLEIEEVPSGLVVLAADSSKSSPFRFELPPGKYRAVARAETDRADMSGVDHGGASSQFTIEANVSARVHLDVGEGGALRITVPDLGGTGIDRSVRLERIMPSGRSAAIFWRQRMRIIDSVARHSQWFPGGETKVTERLPAGTYRIVGQRGSRKSGHKRYDIPVTIKDGEIVDVRID